MIFNLSGGVAAALNFQVVGNPQPANPRENTIWVNTDVKIPSYDFSATQPKSPTDGMLWISTGRAGAVAFNALKKNGIQVYPISAKQYTGGAWVDKTAKIHQSGQWVSWIGGAVFAEGKDYVNGFTVAENYGSVDIGSTIHIIREIAAEGPNGGGATYVTANEPMDISTFRELRYTITVLRTQKNNDDNHVKLTVGFKDASGAWVCSQTLNYATLETGGYTVNLETKGEYYFAVEVSTYLHYGVADIHINEACLA